MVSEMNNENNRKRGNGMKSYRVQYDTRTEEEIENWTYEGPPEFGPQGKRRGIVSRIIRALFRVKRHRNYPDGGFRRRKRSAA
ncbi:MAG: hypothetical protein CL460_06440 [Acidimicrobiaceae bacterium]|jgi:hypothetical protein|nr:hypothetical protein [Acidimicrobiaceae bacterium]